MPTSMGSDLFLKKVGVKFCYIFVWIELHERNCKSAIEFFYILIIFKMMVDLPQVYFVNQKKMGKGKLGNYR